MKRLQLLAAALSCAVAVDAAAADRIDYAAIRKERHLVAVRTTTPIAIDGVLDEAAWGDAPIATGFLQSEPREGEPASEQTEVRVLYDDTFLYVGMFARDSSPGEIIVNDLKKDFDPGANDAFEVILDTFHDERNGYMFATNAMGAKWDAQMVNEGRDVNSNWDGIWTVRTRVTPDGWYAEMGDPVFARSGSPTPTCRPGASTFSGVSGAETKTATGRRCRGSTASSACRWPARSKVCAASGQATICG